MPVNYVKTSDGAMLRLPDGKPVAVNNPSEIGSAMEMNAALIANNVGAIYKFTGTTDDVYTNGEIYIVEEVV